MPVDSKMVRRIARLARIKVSEEDVPRLEGELNAILEWIEMLDEVDTSNAEPLTSMVRMQMKMREDVVTAGQDSRRRDGQCAHKGRQFLRRAEGCRIGPL